MSLRVAKKPIIMPNGVTAKLENGVLSIKGPKTSLDMGISKKINIKIIDNQLDVTPVAFEKTKTQQSDISLDKYLKTLTKEDKMMLGTTCSLINNMITGVSKGFEKKLVLVGVGYRAQQKGTGITLSLGFSHPIEYMPPEGVSIQTPSQTEIVITGGDKEKVGQAAADIRRFRPPEVYKGKGVLYFGEVIVKKETKKK